MLSGPLEARLELAEELPGKVLTAALAVHAELGPFMSSDAYEAALAFEIGQLGFPVERQRAVLVSFDGSDLDLGYRADLLVDGRVVVRLVQLDRMDHQHEASLLGQLALAGPRAGLFLDFRLRELGSALVPATPAPGS